MNVNDTNNVKDAKAITAVMMFLMKLEQLHCFLS